MIVSFMPPDTLRHNNIRSLYYSPNREMISHKDLAEILEDKFHPYQKFIREINQSKPMKEHLADSVLYATSITDFEYFICDRIKQLWLHFLKDNIGSFKTSNPTPLIDTKQYMNNLTFRVRLQSNEADLIRRYHKTDNDYTREVIYDRIADIRYKFDGIK